MKRVYRNISNTTNTSLHSMHSFCSRAAFSPSAFNRFVKCILDFCLCVPLHPSLAHLLPHGKYPRHFNVLIPSSDSIFILHVACLYLFYRISHYAPALIPSAASLFVQFVHHSSLSSYSLLLFITSLPSILPFSPFHVYSLLIHRLQPSLDSSMCTIPSAILLRFDIYAHYLHKSSQLRQGFNVIFAQTNYLPHHLLHRFSSRSKSAFLKRHYRYTLPRFFIATPPQVP